MLPTSFGITYKKEGNRCFTPGLGGIICCMKTCSKCYETKPLDQFYKAAGMRDGRRNDCIACNLAYSKASYKKEEAVRRATEWRKANPEKSKKSIDEWKKRHQVEVREYGYTRRYKISLEEARHWLANRTDCSICHRTENLHLDHDADSGEIRGWLCGSCNRGIGLLQHSPEVLLGAAAYLSREGE